MYSAAYGFQNAAGPAFNGAPPGQNPQMQPGLAPNQPQQQMMYNPQQFPMGAQGPFPGNPNMMPGAASASMMQNAAMPHMAANGQMAYQTPYTSSPYGPGMPANAPQPQLPPNFNMMGGSMPGFAMNAAMSQQQQQPQQQQQQQQQQPQPQQQPQQPQQHQQQQQQQMMRMHPSQQAPGGGMGVSTPQRPFNTAQGPSGSPNPSQQQRQFSPPPPNAQNALQGQAPNSAPQSNPAISTPQTPTFPGTGQPPTMNGTTSAPTPLSPGTESREKEVFGLLLDINQELLCESVQIQNRQLQLKQEHSAPTAEGGGAGKSNEEDKLLQQDYMQCMRRLQSNLGYLASLADRKVPGQIAKGPQLLTAPPLHLKIKLDGTMPEPPSDSADGKPDFKIDREERDKSLKDLYKRLQALYPGIDPNANAGGRPVGAQGGSNQASPSPGPQKTPQMATISAPPQPQATATS